MRTILDAGAAVHLGGILAAHGTATDMSDTTIGITGKLASGDTAVGKRTADDETTGGIDQLLKVGVQAVLACSQHHHGFDDVTEITDLHIRAVLNGAEESHDLAAVVVEADLRLLCFSSIRIAIVNSITASLISCSKSIVHSIKLSSEIR